MNDKPVLTHYFDGVPINKRHLKVVILIALGIVFESMDIYNFSFIAPTLMQNWHITMKEIGTINSLFFWGMLFGSALGGFVSDRIGRKKTFIGSCIVYSVFSLGNGLAPNVAVFMVMRFFTGLGISALVIVAMPYVIEMLPGETRGKWQALNMGLGYSGILLIAVTCKIIVPMGPENWRIVYVIGAAGLFVALMSHFWLEESPRWLVSVGRIKEAEKVVENIVGGGAKADLSHAYVHQEKPKVGYVVREMFSQKHLKNTIVQLGIFAVLYPASFIFMGFAPTLFVMKGFSIEQGLTLSTIMSIGMVAGPFVSSPIADKGGRKWPIFGMTGGLIVFCVLYAFLNNVYSMFIVAGIITLLIQGLCPLTMTYLNELYPTNIRNSASGLIYAAGRVVTAISMVVVPVVKGSFGVMGVIGLVALLYAISGFLTFVWGERTSGKSLEELNDVLNGSSESEHAV